MLNENLGKRQRLLPTGDDCDVNCDLDDDDDFGDGCWC